MIKKIFFLILVSIFIMFPINANAKTLRDIYSELDQLEEEINDNKLQSDATTAEISAKKKEISNLYSEIANTKDDIKNAEARIVELNEEIVLKEEETIKILKYFQITSGEMDYLDYIFGAKTLTDFIHRIVVTEELSAYNEKIVKEMETMIVEQKELKDDLVATEKRLKQKQETARVKVASLSSVSSELEDDHISLEEEINITREMIDLYESMKTCGLDDDINVCARNVLPKDTRFWRPVKNGMVTSEWSPWRCITLNGRPYCAPHSGTDISGYTGKPLYAAAAGKVSYIKYISKSAGYHSVCGGQYIFINHSVDGKEYTTAYLHVHDIYVTVGDIVSKDTMIGSMGGGESYDRCTTGPHLHFTLVPGITASTSNSVNSRNYVNFPNRYVPFSDRTTKY